MTSTRTRWRAGAPLLALGLALFPAGLASRAYADPSPSPAFTIDDARITESSGLTRDPGNNVYWTVNDGDPSGVVYAIGPDGKTKGTLDYAAKPLDVEAVLMVGNRLYVGDIGDNRRNRSMITVYYFDNPAPDDKRSGSYRAYDFVYPDGPRDAEAMLVDRQGRLLVVSKEAEGKVYAAPRQLRTDTPNRLTRVADAPAYVTDGAVLPDGRLVLRNYVSVEVLNPELYATEARSLLPFQQQGESIAVSLDGTSLLAGSEGTNSRVFSVPIPDKLQAVPTPGATPPASPVPTTVAADVNPADAKPAEANPAEAPEARASRTGTLVALLLALLVSIAGGIVVLVHGRNRPSRAAGPMPGGRSRPASGDPRRAADPVAQGESAAPVVGPVAGPVAGPVEGPGIGPGAGPVDESVEPTHRLHGGARRAWVTWDDPDRTAGAPDLGHPLDDDDPTVIRPLPPLDERDR